MQVIHYFDYKSPYAYLAQEETLRLPDEFNIELVLIPYTLDIPGYLGHAEVDEQGNVIASERTAHQWRRVRYSYMDCRREANRRGLTLRGPRKIFDSSIAHIGFLYAQRYGDYSRYHPAVYRQFWRRELDIESPAAIREQLRLAGIDVAGFEDFLATPGRNKHDHLRAEAERQGIFGVPSYLLNGELFWGGERLVRLKERLPRKT